MSLRVISGGERSINGMGLADYIWLDGLGNIHVKKKAIYTVEELGTDDVVPILKPWVATVSLSGGQQERLLLNPAHYLPDPLRGAHHYVVLCEAKLVDGTNHPTNSRNILRIFLKSKLTARPLGTWWGFKQGYRFVKDGEAAGGEHFLAAERHLCCCMDAGLPLHSGQTDSPTGGWNFKLGPREFHVIDTEDPTAMVMADHLIFGRYFLEKVARENGFKLEFTNCSIFFSTEKMRAPVEPEDPQLALDLMEAKLHFPDKAHARHAWSTDLRLGVGPFIEEQGLHPLADPYITITRILDALGDEE